MLTARESDIINLRAYLDKLSEHLKKAENGEKPENDLDIISDALVDLLAALGYQPEDFME